MKRKFGKLFILIPIGLFLISCALIVSQRTQLPDSIKGILFGFPIGIMIMPFMLLHQFQELKIFSVLIA